jgi:hypothetical protein
MKECKRCDCSKSDCEFGKNRKNKDGLSIYCKECERERAREFRKKNPNYKLSSKTWRMNNPEKYKETIKKYLDANPHMTSTERSKKYRLSKEYREKEKIRIKEYNKKNKEKREEYRKIYYQLNRDLLRKKNNQYKIRRLKNDGFYRMKKNVRDRIRHFLVNENFSTRTKQIVGLDSKEFKSYIEQMFSEGMTWDNYGLWHLDHIKPLSLAKTPQEVLDLNYYTNLQPLWAHDNLKKHNKYND